MKLLGLDHPSFRPLWVRVTVVMICLGWGLFEAFAGATLWAVVFLGLGVICAYSFATIEYAAPKDGSEN